MSGFDATNFFAAWLGYQMIALAVGIMVTRRNIPYRMLWLGFLLFFEVRGWIPGLVLLTHFIPRLTPILEIVRFLGAWAGVLIGGFFLSSVNSLVQYVTRKREDAYYSADLAKDRKRDVETLALLTRDLADSNARRVQAMLKTSHDAA